MAQYTQLIKKYINSFEVDSLINSIYDISTGECVHLFVFSAIEVTCESLLKNINQIGELLVDLVIVKRIINSQQFHKGFVFKTYI